MDFDLNPEQALLQDNVERLLREHYAFDQRQRHLALAQGWSRQMWSQYAALGLLALPFDEAHGGAGLGAVESMIVMESFGRWLTLEPYLATVVLGGAALRLAGSAAQQAAILPAVCSGARLLALAHMEPDARYAWHQVCSRARRVAGGWRLDGEKTLVLHGDCADTLIVAARVAGETDDRSGVALFLVDAQAAGVHRRGYALQNDTRAADIRFDAVTVPATALLDSPDDGLPVLERVLDEGIAAICAAGVGALERMHTTTIDYLRTRQQFGVPIGSFQALQHRAVDMLVALEQARSMSYLATMMVAAPALERRKAVSAAKAQFCQSARAIGKDAVQLHGGIGVTLECQVAHYFKHTTTLEFLFGDFEHHIAQLAAAGAFTAAREAQEDRRDAPHPHATA